MEPLTLLLVLVVAWVLFGASGGSSASTANPGNAGAPPPEQSSNQSIPDGTGMGACPPGTSWDGRGCTQPSYQQTDQTAQPVGAGGEEVGVGYAEPQVGTAEPPATGHRRVAGGPHRGGRGLTPPRSVDNGNQRAYTQSKQTAKGLT